MAANVSGIKSSPDKYKDDKKKELHQNIMIEKEKAFARYYELVITELNIKPHSEEQQKYLKLLDRLKLDFKRLLEKSKEVGVNGAEIDTAEVCCQTLQELDATLHKRTKYSDVQILNKEKPVSNVSNILTENKNRIVVPAKNIASASKIFTIDLTQRQPSLKEAAAVQLKKVISEDQPLPKCETQTLQQFETQNQQILKTQSEQKSEVKTQTKSTVQIHQKCQTQTEEKCETETQEKCEMSLQKLKTQNLQKLEIQSEQKPEVKTSPKITIQMLQNGQSQTEEKCETETQRKCETQAKQKIDTNIQLQCETQQKSENQMQPNYENQISEFHFNPILNQNEELTTHDKLFDRFTQKLHTFGQLNTNANWKRFFELCGYCISMHIAEIDAQFKPDNYVMEDLKNFILSSFMKELEDIQKLNKANLKEYYVFDLTHKLLFHSIRQILTNTHVAKLYSAVIVELWHRIKEFGTYFLTQLYTDCNFMVPLIRPRSVFKTDLEYKLFFKFKIVNGSVLEDFQSYKRRQGAITRLFASLLVSNNGTYRQHPFPIVNGWIWLTNFINTKPEMMDVCANTLVQFLQVAGREMLSLYGKQFRSLLITIRNEYVPKLYEARDGRNESKLELVQLLNLLLF